MKALPLLATVCMISSSIGLIGCSQPAEPDSVAAAPATSAASMSAAVTEAISKPVQISSLLPMQAYDCLPAQKITATYDRENRVESQAMLEINGFIHVLYATSKTESVYRTDGGLVDGQAMLWTVQTDGATLSSVPLTENSNTPEKILYRCSPL